MWVKNNIQKLLYFTLLGVICLPFIQEQLKLAPVPNLNGYFTTTEKVELTVNSWMNGSFQENNEKIRKEKVGFHDFFIRLNNQRRYSLFKELNTNDLIKGKDGMLFGFSYISTYFGNDYVGYPTLKVFNEKIKFIQDSLGKRGKLFFPLIVPGKSAIYPELIPDRFYKENTKKTTNYESMIHLLDSSETTYLDLKKYILENRALFTYPVFPKNGVHWTGNTVAIVSDTLLDFIGTQTGKRLTDMKLSKGKVTISDYQFTDYDIGESLNLFAHISSDSLHYPKVEYVCDNCDKPRTLGVGDSFIQSFRGFFHTYDSAFHPDSYLWYYNKAIDWPEKFNGQGILMEDLDLEEEINKAEIIILESTDENLRQTGFGFVDQVYDLLKNGKKVFTNEELNTLDKYKKKESIIEKAQTLIKLTGYSLEKQIHIIAASKLKASKSFDFDTEVKVVMHNIRQNPEWLKVLQQQAKERNITLEENIYLNAKWVVENEK